MGWLLFFVGVLVGWLIELLIDYLFWRKRHATLLHKCEELEASLHRLQEENAQLQRANQELKERLEACQAETDSRGDETATRMKDEELPAPEVTPDDLRKIEGIGPKIAQLLNDAGIYTFTQLAEAEIVLLQQVLIDAGPRFKLADPSSWPEQAALAANGDWEGLKALQDSLDKGRR